MELAATQLLIGLVQALFTPADAAELHQRIAQPLDEAAYDAAVASYEDWFDLSHPETPFMQSRGVSAAEITPIQKLFIGLPEGNNHSFFDPEGAVSTVCAGCAAIATFNQASCSPSFGGGFKGTLRGGAPITTLIDAPDLRRRIWENVLPLSAQTPWREAQRNLPTWIDPIRAGERIQSTDIGLTRGLFWQPARIELIPGQNKTTCDSCGHESDQTYIGFNKEKFNYTVEGVWKHPHSPLLIIEKKGQIEKRYASFTTTAPAWVQLSQFLPELAGEEEQEGHEAATVVRELQQRSLAHIASVGLLVGGYRNKQASVLERRYELFSFRPGWANGVRALSDFVQIGKHARDSLYRSLMWAVKGQKDKFKGIGVDLHKSAERDFYDRSEPLMYERLRAFDFTQVYKERVSLREAVNQLARNLYDSSVAPYGHDVGLVRAIAAGRSKLFKDLNA